MLLAVIWCVSVCVMMENDATRKQNVFFYLVSGGIEVLTDSLD